MDILVIGSGGREHAICWSFAKSPKVNKIYCLPGNGGIAKIAECVDIGVLEFDKIIEFLRQKPSISLTFVAPDDPLSLGLVDRLEAEGFVAFGPKKDSAIIESSKSFSKNLMKKYGIPTAEYAVFDTFIDAKTYLDTAKFPLVIKADGLALGKGVIICETKEDGVKALEDIMLTKAFGKAGNSVVIEEFMIGKEVSILAFTDGYTVKPMVSSQDHKRAYDNDLGLNTGGMGTFSPTLTYTKEIEEYCTRYIFQKTIDAMRQEGRLFKGVLYYGLMLTSDGVKVLEYNARFGDPETQVVLPLLETDLVEICFAIINGELDRLDIKWSNKSALCVILASGGYPKEYEKGLPITIDDVDSDILLFHAGTAQKNRQLVTNGGRVIGMVAVGDNISDCREKVYKNIDKVKFDKCHFRKDIGIK